MQAPMTFCKGNCEKFPSSHIALEILSRNVAESRLPHLFPVAQFTDTFRYLVDDAQLTCEY
jgi:hypothetical protein